MAKATIIEAAARSSMAKSTFQRIEAGSPTTALVNLVAAAEAVGLDLVCQVYPSPESALRDREQLTIAKRLVAMTHASWIPSLEEPAGSHGEAVDLLLRRPDEWVVLEIERLLLDWQAQLRRLTIKRDWLAATASVPVRLVVVVTDTRRNRAALAPFASLISRTMPVGSRSVLRALREGQLVGADGLCWIRPWQRRDQFGRTRGAPSE